MRSVAFLLPQFHPIPENDAWWGTGFTEWRNVARCRPRFTGHYQPRLPADLGFYDLRLADTRAAQAELAVRFDVDAFCYYHYWFHGRRLLERPFGDVLASGEPNFPFMLCWANENWTRRWDGADSQILMHQTYSAADDLEHARYLAEAFSDPRYVTLHGRPVFLVYRAHELPEPKRTTDTWRAECTRLGLPEPYLCRVEAHAIDRGDPRPLGFDASVEFQPDVTHYPRRLELPKVARAFRRLVRPRSGYRWNNIFEYSELVESALAKPSVDYVRFPGVTPSWDNSARRTEWATIFRGSTPQLFEAWVEHVVARAKGPSAEFLFVNAWNEWAEGNHLEPDLKFGLGYLAAHREGKRLGLAHRAATI